TRIGSMGQAWSEISIPRLELPGIQSLSLKKNSVADDIRRSPVALRRRPAEASLPPPRTGRSSRHGCRAARKTRYQMARPARARDSLARAVRIVALRSGADPGGAIPEAQTRSAQVHRPHGAHA